MRTLAVTWANDARGRSVFWLHAAVRHGIWPSAEDQLGITPRASSDSSGYIFETQNRVPQLISPFQATRRRNLSLERAAADRGVQDLGGVRDRDVLAVVSQGHPDSLALVYHRFAPLVYSIALRSRHSGQRPGRDVRHYALQAGPGTGHREHAAALLLTARRRSQPPGVLDLTRYSDRTDRLGAGIDKYGDSRMAAQPGQAAAASWPDAADRDA